MIECKHYKNKNKTKKNIVAQMKHLIFSGNVIWGAYRFFYTTYEFTPEMQVIRMPGSNCNSLYQNASNEI